MMAARALGLDCGPMSGFDNVKVDEVFFEGTSFRSNFYAAWDMEIILLTAIVSLGLNLTKYVSSSDPRWNTI